MEIRWPVQVEQWWLQNHSYKLEIGQPCNCNMFESTEGIGCTIIEAVSHANFD